MNKSIFKFHIITVLFFFISFSACKDAENNLEIPKGDLIAKRKEQVQAAFKQAIPIIKLENLSDSKAKEAQELAIANPQFTREIWASRGVPFKNEIFQCKPLSKADQLFSSSPCKEGSCYKVELYNFALNKTTIAIVEPGKKIVHKVVPLPNTQPEIPDHLSQLAVYIAAKDELVQKELGYKPEEEQSLMERTKTSLNKTRCERSMHLCVAPTFVKEPRALWAIVDLTDENLVGTRWTEVGNTGIKVTERRLQNDNITDNYCEKETHYEKGDWKLSYIMTNSDGLCVYNAYYKNEKVVNSMKLVDWHVSYSNVDGFGYSDAIGCPYFSSAAVVAVEAPEINPIIENNDTTGFVLIQSYWSEGWPAPCNYNYQQKFEFYKDGSFRMGAASIGRGCGMDGIYRPVMRYDITNAKSSIAEYKGNDQWKNIDKEYWVKQKDITPYSKEGYQYKIKASDTYSYYVEPSRGQFSDGGRNDNAWVYVTKKHNELEEGNTELATIGPCCNQDYKQGPEKFINQNPESITDSEFILWYVPEMRNDNKPGEEYCWAERVLVDGVYINKIFPCYAGPKFVFIK